MCYIRIKDIYNMKGIDDQIKKIELFAKDIEKKAEHIQYDKYKYIYDEAVKYIKTKRVLLYGGSAINDLLPKNDKIYDEKVLPDIDVFSTNGRNLAKEIVKHFIAKGYNKITTNFVNALHENTYKVYIDSVQVFDISTVSKKAFKKLSKNSVIGDNGIRVVNIQFLRLSLHMIMSQLYDARRWQKIFERLVIFYKHFPPKPCQVLPSRSHSRSHLKLKSTIPKKSSYKYESFSEEIKESGIIDKIYEFLEHKDYILFGIKELYTYINSYSKSKSKVTNLYLPENSKLAPIQIIASGNILDIAHLIVKHLNIPNIAISDIFEEDEFIPEHIIIKYKNHQLVEIYNTNVCMTYINFKGYRIASLHTIIRMYLSMILSSYEHYETDNDYLECIINMLTIIQKNMSKSRKKLFEQIIEQCYGPYYGLITQHRRKLLRAVDEAVDEEKNNK